MSAGTPEADVRDYVVVHLTLRHLLDRLVSASERLTPAEVADVVEPRWALYRRGLQHHHDGEESDIFPVVRERCPDFAELDARLRAEHETVLTLIAGVDAALTELGSAPAESATSTGVAEALVALRESLDPHLDLEDEQLLPLVAEAFTPKEWKQTNEHLMRTLPKEDLPYVAGALDETVRGLPKDEWPPPPPFAVRMLLAASWRKNYARWIAPLEV